MFQNNLFDQTFKSLGASPRSRLSTRQSHSIGLIKNFRAREKKSYFKNGISEALVNEFERKILESGLMTNVRKGLFACSLIEIKKFTLLDDEIYLLISGKVVYAKTPSAQEIDKKEQLLNLAKNGTFTLLRKNPYHPDPELAAPYTIIIDQPYALIRSDKSNLMSLQDCSLLKIDDELMDFFKYNELKKEINDLCNNAYLRGELNTERGNIFSVNTDLLHSFKRIVFPFGRTLRFHSLAIIQKGTLRSQEAEGAKHTDKENKFRLPIDNYRREIKENGILVPNLSYQVVSEEVVIVKIEANPTMCYWNTFLLQSEHYQYGSSGKACGKSMQTGRETPKACTQRDYNRSRSKEEAIGQGRQLKCGTKKGKQEAKVHSRKLKEVAKKCNAFVTISMPTCIKEKETIENQIKKYRRKENDKSIEKRPNILFEMNKQRSKKGVPCLKKIFEGSNFFENKGQGPLHTRYEGVIPKFRNSNYYKTWGKETKVQSACSEHNGLMSHFLTFFEREERKYLNQSHLQSNL